MANAGYVVTQPGGSSTTQALPPYYVPGKGVVSSPLMEGVTVSPVGGAPSVEALNEVAPVITSTGQAAKLVSGDQATIKEVALAMDTQQSSIAGAAGVAGLLTNTLGALGVSVPGWLATILGVGAAGYGVYQALGGGEGEGLFGNNLLGGDESSVDGIPLGGPGLAEPPAQYVLKEWSRDTAAGRVQYYRVQLPGWRKPKTAAYYTAFKRWVVFKAPHLAVIGKNQPSHRQLTRLRRNLSRHSADARTILKITSPTSLATPGEKRRRHSYRR